MMTRAKPELDRDLIHQVDAAYTFARWALGHPQDAESLVEEVITGVPRSAQSVRDASARVWLLRMTRAAARKRVSSGHSRRHGDSEVFADLIAPAQGGSNIGARAAGMELKRSDIDTLRRAIATLALEQREVILLRDTHGLSYRDISAIVAIPAETLMVRLGRARDALESCLLTSQTTQAEHGETAVVMDAYIDAEIDIHTAAAFVEHIARCRACTSRLLNRSRLVQHIRNVTATRAPEKLRCGMQDLSSAGERSGTRRQSMSTL